MKTAGIIAEYNPFHKGHEYQIRYTKERLKADYVIVAMSGDYVQRGTPALISKHARAEMDTGISSTRSAPHRRAISARACLEMRAGVPRCGVVLTLYLKCRYPSLQQVQKPLQWGAFPC